MGRKAVILVLASVFSAAPAVAQKKVDSPAKKKVKDIDFKRGSDVDGQGLGPNGGMVVVRGDISREPLIKIRQNFRREILAATDAL